jgi:hypothetical protein
LLSKFLLIAMKRGSQKTRRPSLNKLEPFSKLRLAVKAGHLNQETMKAIEAAMDSPRLEEG